MLNKIKIGPKLISGFLLVAFISVVVGIVGIDRMHKIDKADTFLYEKATLPLASLVELSLTFEMAIRDLRDLGRVKDPQKRESLIAAIESHRARIKKACDLYEATVIDDEGKKIFQELIEARKNIAADVNNLYTLSRANNTEEVYKVIDNSLVKHSVEEENIIERMIKYNTDMAKKISGNNTSTAKSATIILILVIIVGVIIAVGIGIFLTISITKPLNQGVALMGELSKGNLLVTFDKHALSVSDETGILTRAMKEMADTLKDTITFAFESSENVSTGSIQISSASQGISQGSSEQAASVEEISASIEEISASIEQMTASINQNSENANQTEKIALKSSADAREGGEAVQKTVVAMKQIAEKISIIQEIARQTNLLSLNASIEAARAGEHGKGFAVVASAVQKLAERSQDAAEEISKLSKSSVDVAENAGEMLKKLVPDIQKTADLVSEINAASKEQNTGIQQVNLSIQQVNTAIQHFNQVIQSNASASEELASTTEELSSQAEELKSRISFFQIDSTMRTHKNSTNNSKRHSEVVQKTVNTQYAATPAPLNGKTHAINEGVRKESNSGIALNMVDDDDDENFQRI